MTNEYNKNETVRILENMKEDMKVLNEKRATLIEKENAIKNDMSKDGFDDVCRDLGIF